MTRTKSSRALLSVVLAVLMAAAFMPSLTYSSFAATAKKATKVTKLNHTGAKVYGKVGNKYVLKYKLSPSKLTSSAQKTVWKSSDSKIVKVIATKGKHATVKVKGVGTAKVTVTTKANPKAKATWTFKTKKAETETKTTLTGVTVSAPNAADPAKEVKVGTELQASVAPADAKDVTYQWYAGDTAISGATSAKYTVTTAEIGKTITVKATSKNEVASTATAAVSAVKVNSVTLQKYNAESTATDKYEDINGASASLNIGDQLKAKVAVDGATVDSAVSFQWYRLNKNASGQDFATAISGATSETYTVTAADKGASQLYVVVTPKTGVTTATGITEKDGTIKKAVSATGDKGIAAAAKVEIQAAGKKVTAAPVGTELTAVVTPSDAKVTYQWKKNGVAIKDATSATYKPTEKGNYSVTVKLADSEATYTFVDAKKNKSATATESVNVTDQNINDVVLSDAQAAARTNKTVLAIDNFATEGNVTVWSKDENGKDKALTSSNYTLTWYVNGKETTEPGISNGKYTLKDDSTNTETELKVGDAITVKATGTGVYAGFEKTSNALTVQKLGEAYNDHLTFAVEQGNSDGTVPSTVTVGGLDNSRYKNFTITIKQSTGTGSAKTWTTLATFTEKDVDEHGNVTLQLEAKQDKAELKNLEVTISEPDYEGTQIIGTTTPEGAEA
jgi:hypothetical protein